MCAQVHLQLTQTHNKYLMFLSYVTLFVALALSVIAAWYSIAGLAAIFAAAVVPIMIMGGVLEVAKVVTTLWLHEYWHRSRRLMKLYLVPAVAVLMLITSMGIFGFLSKAHSDQTLISGDAQSKIAVYDEKIKTQEENIAAARRALEQMDAGVDQVLGRSTTETGARRAMDLRRAQQKERARLLSEISQSQQLIAELKDARAPIAADIRKIEAEVGPIKYIAALIYGNNTDADLLEKAVTWVIILLVVVFDPLAIMLLLAATQSLRWHREQAAAPAQPDPEPGPKPELEPEPEVPTTDPHDAPPAPNYSYLGQPFAHFRNLAPMVYHAPIEPAPRPLPVVEPEAELTVDPDEQVILDESHPDVKAAMVRWKAANPGDTLKNQRARLARGEIDQLPWMSLVIPESGFGTAFPGAPIKGMSFVRTDRVPHQLFKYNGRTWIAVDKSQSDSYTYNHAYLDHLIDIVARGEYDADMLSESEQEQIAQHLRTSRP